MNEKLKNLFVFLKPYGGIIYFVVLLLGTHFLWKLCVNGNLQGQQISILGKDLTAQFHYLSQLTAQATYRLVRLFPGTDTFTINDVLLYFTDGKIKILIIWGCTAVKQVYIFLVIMLFYSGSWKKKAWYIPLGCIILVAYNIIRIASICALTKNHPEWFNSLHEGVFRYIFYGLIFLLWLIWEEVISKNKKTVSS